VHGAGTHCTSGAGTALSLQCRALAQNTTRSVCETLSFDVLSVNSFDFEKKEVEFESVQPYLNFTGTYKLSGKLASLPVFGNGPYNTSLCKCLGSWRHCRYLATSRTALPFVRKRSVVIHRHWDMAPRRQYIDTDVSE
jgi:hypothetical protein